MRLLLDTHVLLWWLGGHRRLGTRARTDIGAADDVFVSTVSGYEITFKSTLGKLRVLDDLDRYIAAEGFRVLPIQMEHSRSAGRLPVHHRDPFDRLLVAQARCDGLTLATADNKLSVYDVPILDAAA